MQELSRSKKLGKEGEKPVCLSREVLVKVRGKKHMHEKWNALLLHEDR